MDEGNWVISHGLDGAKRLQRMKALAGMKRGGMALVLVSALAFFYFILWETEWKGQDAFAMAMGLSVCFYAGFSLINNSETEVKMYDLLDSVKKERG